MKKILCLFLSIVILMSAFSCVGVVGFAKGAKLTGVSFTPAEELSAYEYTYGYWSISYNEDTEEQENTFYYNLFSEYEEGNVITLRYSDGTSVDYTCHDWLYVNSKGKELNEDTLHFTDNQKETPWTVGTNYISVSFGGFTTEVPVEILPTPVENVEFVPDKPIELVAFGNGDYFRHEYGPDEGEDYFAYQLKNLSKKGNKYVVTYKTGEVVTYTSDGKEFINENGEALNNNYITEYDVQDISPWVNPGEYAFPFYFMGCKSEIPVTLVEPPVESINYVPASAYTFTENFNGWTVDCSCDDCKENKGEYFKYNIEQTGFPRKGDKLVVTYKDGTVTEYVKEDKKFKDDSGKALPFVIRYNDLQAQNHWNTGTEFFQVTYLDKSVMIPVQILENPVKSISVTTTKPIEIYRFTKGYWGFLDGKKTYTYDNPMYDGSVGLCVEYIDGTTETYRYDDVEEGFYTEDGKELVDMEWVCDQDEKAWGLGVHSFVIKYMQRTCKLKVKIIKNPVKSIEFVPAEPLAFRYEKDGEWDYLLGGDDTDEQKAFLYDTSKCTPYKKANKLIVNYTSGKKETFTYNANKKKFLTSKGKTLEKGFNVSYIDTQTDNPWVWKSASNTLTVEYMGRTTKVKVILHKGVLPEMATIKSCEAGKGKITISWKSLPDAISYKIYKKTQTAKGYTDWKLIGTTEKTSFVDSGFKKDTTVQYIVHTVNPKGRSKYNKSKVKTTKYVKPAGSFEVYNSVNGMRIKFAPAAGTVDVYRRLKGDSKWVLLGNVPGNEEYIWDPNAKTGKTYEYAVVRKIGKYKSVMVISEAVTFVASPEIKSLKNTSKGVSVTWKKIAGAEEYRVYRREPGQSKYKYLGASKKLTYLDKTAKKGKTYRYIVRATCKGEISGYREKEIKI